MKLSITKIRELYKLGAFSFTDKKMEREIINQIDRLNYRAQSYLFFIATFYVKVQQEEERIIMKEKPPSTMGQTDIGRLFANLKKAQLAMIYTLSHQASQNNDRKMLKIEEEFEKHKYIRLIQFKQYRNKCAYTYLDDFIEDDVILFE